MRSISGLAVLGSICLSTSSAQDFTWDGSFFTWDHNWKTNLYSLTRVTPATLGPGETKYHNGIESFNNWTKRVGLTWYFDRICPCEWGCRRDWCDWCQHDKRMPWWYAPRTRLEDDEEDVEGVEPYKIPTNPPLPPLYDCIEPLEGGVIITMEDVEALDEEYEYQMITDFVKDWTENEAVFSTGGTKYNTWWVLPKFSISGIKMLLMNNVINGVNVENGQHPQGIPVGPKGVKYQAVWWNYVYSRTPTYGGGAHIAADFYYQDVRVPANQDILLWYSVYKQAIQGSVLADLVLSQARTGKPYITWRMDIPRIEYHVYIRSDDNDGWNYYYPLVNEILCGPALNPTMCRTTDQQHGRIVHRFYGLWDGDVAPFINRTVYKWDKSLEDPNDFYNTDFEIRHQMDILELDRLSVNNVDIAWRELGRRLEGFENLDFEGRDYALNLDDPRRSFKIY